MASSLLGIGQRLGPTKPGIISYHADTEDLKWLSDLDPALLYQVNVELLEFVMDRLDKVWNEKEKEIEPKTECSKNLEHPRESTRKIQKRRQKKKEPLKKK